MLIKYFDYGVGADASFCMCIYVRIRVNVRVCIYVFVYVFVYVCVCMCICVCLCVFICVYECMCVNTFDSDSFILSNALLVASMFSQLMPPSCSPNSSPTASSSHLMW